MKVETVVKHEARKIMKLPQNIGDSQEHSHTHQAVQKGQNKYKFDIV